MVKHNFTKQLIQYSLTKLLNEDKNVSEIAVKAFELCVFKSILLKNKVITSYYYKCIDPNNCVSCKRTALDVRGLVGVFDVDGADDIDRV